MGDDAIACQTNSLKCKARFVHPNWDNNFKWKTWQQTWHVVFEILKHRVNGILSVKIDHFSADCIYYSIIYYKNKMQMEACIIFAKYAVFYKLVGVFPLVETFKLRNII